MSFVRSLTGESSLIATVVLNTNICSDTVSTVNLSATNASFINITTNTWQSGNVSTPNVIATWGYFSNINTCNFSVDIVNTSYLYSSNASFNNVSIATKLSVSNISSLRNVFSDNTVAIYSSGGVSIRDINQSNPAVLSLYYASTPSIDTYGLYFETNKSGVSGGYSKIVAGENMSLRFYADTVLQAENTSTSGWTFYSSINSSTCNISTLTSSVINVSLVNAKNFNVSTLGVASLNCSNISTNSICVSQAYTYTTTAEYGFYNMSRNASNELYVMSREYNDPYASLPNLIHTDGMNTSYFLWTLASGASNVSPFLISVSGVSVSNLQCPNNISSLYMNTCYLTGWRTYTSQVNISDLLSLQGATLSFRKGSSTSILSGQYVTGDNTSNPTMLNDGLLITKYQFNTSGGVAALYFDSNNICALSSNLYVSNISTSALLINNISAKQVSSTSMATSWMNASNISAVAISTSTLSTSQISLMQNTSQYGYFQYGANRCNIMSVGSLAPTLTLGNNGNIRFEISSNGVSSYETFYSSIANFSNLYASNFAPTTLTTSTVNASTLNTCNFNLCGNFSTSMYNNGLILRNFSVNPATNYMSGPTTLELDYTLMLLGVSRQRPGLKFSADETNAIIDTDAFIPLNFTHQGVSILQHIRDTGASRRWVFYSDIYNVCNTYLSSVSVSNASLDTTNISMLYASNASVNYLSVNQIYVDNDVAGINGRFEVLEIKNAAENIQYWIDQKNATIQHNISNSGVNAIDFTRLNSSLVTFNTSQCLFWNPIYVSDTYTSRIYSVSSNISNISTSYLSATNGSFVDLSTSTLSVSSINLSSLSGFSAPTGTITTLYSTSTFVSNLSASNASISGRLTVLNISATSVSASGRINCNDLIAAGNITATGATVFGNTGSFNSIAASTITVSQNVSAGSLSTPQTNSTSIATSWINASNASITNASLTTITGTTARYSTGNFSTIAMSNPVVNMSVSNLYCSALGFTTNGTASSFGSIGLTGGKMVIQSVGSAATALQFANTGNVRFEISSAGVSSYATFYASTGNFSTLNASNFTLPATVNTTTINASNGNFSNLNASNFTLPATVTTTTINASTGNFSAFNVSSFNPASINTTLVNASNGYFSALYASTWVLPTTIDVSTVNSSTINTSIINAENMSGMNSIYSLGSINLTCDGLYIENTYASVGGTAYFQMNYWKTGISSILQGFTMYADEPRGSVIDGGSLPLVIKQDDIEQVTNTSTSGWLFKNVINSSYQNNFSKLAVSNLSATNVSISTALTIPNNVSANTSNISLKLHSGSTNTSSSGIVVPNYIDGLDTTNGLFIGYNHTAGFINFSRAIRSYANINLDGNLNQITTTNTLGVGRNLTTGHLWLGDTAMTGNISINTSGTIQIGNTTMGGNISIDTRGDVVFGCDRRSTWNTSGLIASSTQLGSFYRQVASVVSTTKTTTGQTFIFSPVGGNTSLTVVPVGLYLVTASGFIRTQSAYNANLTSANIGTCYGATYPDFSGGNTTRQYHQTLGTMNSSGTTNNYWHLAFTGVVNMSITNQYIGAFMSVTAAQAATVGNVYFELSNVTVIKIA